MKLARTSALLLLTCATSKAGALQQALDQGATQASLQPPAAPSVEVATTRDPEWKPYRTMLRGVDAFDSNRRLAPAAPLRFMLRPLDSVALDGINLRIAGNKESVSVPVAADGTFVLPRDRALADDEADLMVNRRKNRLSIRPDIRTPGLPANERRLGDLRLECQVRWTIQKDDLSFLQRNTFRLLGGPCESGAVKTFYFADRPVSAAWIVADGRRVALETAKNGAVFRPPLHDTSWPDEARIELHFAEAGESAGAIKPATVQQTAH